MLRGAEVLASLIMFTAVYLLLVVLFFFLLDRKIKHGPEPAPEPAPPTAMRENISFGAGSSRKK